MKYLLKQLILLVVIIGIFLAIGLHYDFYQVFGLSNNIHTLDQRRINPGIARHYDYETAIIGTSTSENILVNEFNEVLDTKGVNLVLSGGTAYGHSLMLKKTLEFNKAKHIYYGLDMFSYAFRPDETRVPLSPTFWSESRWHQMLSIFQMSTLKNLFNKPVLESTMTEKGPSWVEHFGYWGDQFTYAEEGAKSFDVQLAGTGLMNIDGVLRFRKPEFSLENFKVNFAPFLEVIAANPTVEFDIYFPPVSMLWWHCLDLEKKTQIAFDFKEYIVSTVAQFSNVSVHDFQQNFAVSNDLDNYKDMIHFGPDISQAMLKWLKDDRFVVDSKKQKVINKNIKTLIQTNQPRFATMNQTILDSVNNNPNTWRSK